MRVICTYTGSVRDVKPEVAEAIAKYAPMCEYKETVGIFGYNEVMLKEWGKDDLVVIEADKVITEDVIPSFEACDELWCCYSYFNFPEPWRREVFKGLGCTKYSLEFQQSFPPKLWLFGDWPDWPPCPDCKGFGCWRNLDVRIATRAMANGVGYHCHGRVEHLHEYKDNGWMEHMDWGDQFAGPLWDQPRDIEGYLEAARKRGWLVEDPQSQSSG